MTVGDLAERTGVSRKTIRDLEGRGLIYTAGRSESNYRLFGEEALWCVETIKALKALGLTVSEIEQLGKLYLERPEEPLGARLDLLLEQTQRRLSRQVAELEQTLDRIAEFRAANRAALAGEPSAALGRPDPSRTRQRPTEAQPLSP